MQMKMKKGDFIFLQKETHPNKKVGKMNFLTGHFAAENLKDRDEVIKKQFITPSPSKTI
jgi:hypothetical protein